MRRKPREVTFCYLFRIIEEENMELSKEKADLVFEIIEIAKTSGKIKCGTNEVTKIIERGEAKLVAAAKDVTPPEIVMHLPLLCKEKEVPYFDVTSKEELGAAAGLSVSTASVVVMDEGNAKKQLSSLVGSKKTE